MNKRKNYSRKREAILDTLRSTKTHPTAEWVYLQLKSQYPDLSSGTVHRNLSQFTGKNISTEISPLTLISFAHIADLFWMFPTIQTSLSCSSGHLWHLTLRLKAATFFFAVSVPIV